MMKQKNKILLLFPDGVGIRNYLYSDVFKNIESELVLFHNFDKETVSEIQLLTGISQEEKIPKYKESLKEKFLRELICLARLHYNSKISSNPFILSNWNKIHKGFAKKMLYTTIEKIAPFVTKYDTILQLENVYQKVLRKTDYYNKIRELLHEIKPESIFCSHQRAVQAAPIFAAAQDLGIPTTTVIFSWDNLPKARLALRADSYWVWSDFMKKEMTLYYPEIPQDSVKVTGTPQFDFYKEPKNIIDKTVFYSKYELDVNKKIICYSGDDEKTSPDDPKYLDDLADELIKAGLQNDFQILLRRCPVDFSGRYTPIIQKYGDLIKEAPPLWHFKNTTEWTSVYPAYDDVALLVSTVYYSDIVVNVGSTMAFDFAMFNKPCAFINYDQKEKKDEEWSVKKIYQFQHFKSIPTKKAVYWLCSKNEINDIIKDAIENGCTEDMKIWSKIIIKDFNNAIENI